jgi:hypothetical protein
MKYVKILPIFILALICIPMLGIQASAHSPSLMSLNYEEDNLRVIILHLTVTPRAHRVFRILISINGELVEEEGYGKQPGFFLNFYKFPITAQPGDEITLQAFCSFFGQKTKSITV